MATKAELELEVKDLREEVADLEAALGVARKESADAAALRRRLDAESGSLDDLAQAHGATTFSLVEAIQLLREVAGEAPHPRDAPEFGARVRAFLDRHAED